MVDRQELQDVFKEQAEWRREKAKQSPDEERYLAAAAIFDRLAATVDAIPRDVFIAFSKLEVTMVYWIWNSGPKCYAKSALAHHRNPPRNSSDLLSRIG
jgi:hypothetical protein